MDQTCMMRVGESVLRAQDGMCPDWPSLHPTTGQVGGPSLGGISVAGRVACLCACQVWLIHGQALGVLQHRYVRPGAWYWPLGVQRVHFLGFPSRCFPCQPLQTRGSVF